MHQSIQSNAVTPAAAGKAAGGLRRSMRLFLVLGVAFSLTVTAASTTLAGPLKVDDDPEGATREPDRSGARVDFVLRNGNELSFVPVFNEKGEIDGYGVVERIVPGGQEVAQMDEFSGLDPAELMNALTTPEAKIPRELVDLYGLPSRGDQGWGLGLVPGPVQGGGGDNGFSCFLPDAFDDDFPGYQEQFTSLYDGPENVPSHWLPMGLGRYYTWGAVYDVRQYYTKVIRCSDEDSQFNWDPHVRVSYRNDQNFPDWGVAYFDLGILLDFGWSTSLTWHPPAPSSIYDFRLYITNARSDDAFHIGIEWSKAFGFAIS